MNKDGHIGVVQKTSQPVNKMDYIGFQSGMSGASNITALPQKVAPPQSAIYKPAADTQMNATNNSII